VHRVFHPVDAYLECDILIFIQLSKRKSWNVKGVNRAFPYVATDDVNSVIEEHTPTLFRLVRTFF